MFVYLFSISHPLKDLTWHSKEGKHKFLKSGDMGALT